MTWVGQGRHLFRSVSPGAYITPLKACNFHLSTLQFILLVVLFNTEANSSLIMDLTTLPPEIFETILTYLDLHRVKALRLTNRKLADLCIGPRFLGSIHQPVLDVSSENLRSLCALARNPALSKKIKSLTFVTTSLHSSELEKNVASGEHTVRESSGPLISASVISYSPEELTEVKADLKWLKAQQETRANESSSEIIDFLQSALRDFGVLDSIHLDGAVILGRTQRGSAWDGEWHPLWMRASQVFSWVVTAMVQAKASVKTFDVYRSTPKCCVPSGHITTYASSLNAKHFEILGKSMESFKLSMSEEVQSTLDMANSDEETLSMYEKAARRTFGFSSGHLSRGDPRAVLADGTPGIASLLKSASALRELDLSFRQTIKGERLFSYDRIIESITHETRFPNLEICALSGFLAKGESILLFLQKHPNLRSFTLHQCTLTTGSWTPIFSHLETSMPRLENLSLSNLFGKHMQDSRHAIRDPWPHLNNEEQEQDEETEDEKGEQEVDGMVNLQPIWDTDDAPRETRYPTSRGYRVHTRNFNRDELKRGLVFRPIIGGRVFGSPEVMRWRNSWMALYGPP